MCGPEVVWQWATLDIAYVLVLMGGSLVLRARCASAFAWAGFGSLSVGVGGFLFWATLRAETAVAAAAPTAEALLVAGC